MKLFFNYTKEHKLKKICTFTTTYLILFFFIFITTCSAEAIPVPGIQILQLGGNASTIGMAGACTADTSDIGTMPLNPAVAAHLLRKNLYLSYGMLGEINTVNGSFSLPVSIGVLSLGYTGIMSAYDFPIIHIGTLHKVQANFAKEISDYWRFGFTLNVLNASVEDVSSIGVNIDTSVLKTEIHDISSEVGVHTLTYGIQLRNIGMSPSYRDNTYYSETDILAPPEVRGGINLLFLKMDTYNMYLASDLGLTLAPFNFLYSASIGNHFLFNGTSFKKLIIKLGYMFSSDEMGYPGMGPLAVGLQADFQLGKTDLIFQYSTVQEELTSDNGFSHFVSLSAAFGYKDESKPVIQIKETENGDAIILEPVE